MSGGDLQHKAEVKWKQQTDAKATEADTIKAEAAAADAEATRLAVNGGIAFAVAATGIGAVVVHAEKIANSVFKDTVKKGVQTVAKKAVSGGVGVARSAVKGIKNLNFGKVKIDKHEVSSWTDFYINMEIDMAVNRFVAFGLPVTKVLALGHFGDLNHYFETINMAAFADALADSYDEAVHNGGKTLWGGGRVNHGGGHVSIMKAMLLSILEKTSKDPNGDLLRDIGPAVQAYWTAAFLECSGTLGTPTIPCIGAVKNVTKIPVDPFPGADLYKKANDAAANVIGKGGFIGRAIKGKGQILPPLPHPTANLCLMPGIWTPITVPSNSMMSPFLLSFIASATLHLLTVGGILTALCQYPAPAPLPIPGVLPWVGYWITPVSNPLKMLKAFTTIEYIAAAVGKAAETYHAMHESHEEGLHVTALSVIGATQQTFGDAALVEQHKKHLEAEAEHSGLTMENLHKTHTVNSKEEKAHEEQKKTGKVDPHAYVNDVIKSFDGKKDSRSISTVQKLKALDKANLKVSKPDIKIVHH